MNTEINRLTQELVNISSVTEGHHANYENVDLESLARLAEAIKQCAHGLVNH